MASDSMELPVLQLDKCGSTQDEARAMMTRGQAPHGMLIVATEQTAGRGRRGRVWLSPKGGLYVTLVLRMPREGAAIRWLPVLASLAIIDAIESWLVDNRPGRTAYAQTEGELQIKWPNDVMAASGKMAGLLVEHPPDLQPDGGVWLVGLGLNLLPLPRELRPDDQAVSSMAEWCGSIPPSPLEIAVLWRKHLLSRYDTMNRSGPLETRLHADRRLWGKGRRAALMPGEGQPDRVGVVLGLSPQGGLIVLEEGPGASENASTWEASAQVAGADGRLTEWWAGSLRPAPL